MKTVDDMFIFDVDGVICDLKEKKAKPSILQHLHNQLKKGIPVALNTGRALKWVVTRAAKTLIDNPKLKPFLENFIIIGEKGGAWLTFDENGNPQQHIDKSLSVSSNLKKEIRKLVASKYSKSMFVDESKKTAISVEMNDGYDLREYQKDQKSLIPQMNSLINLNHLEHKLLLTPNPIAIDIDTKGVGKHLGMKKILDILKERKIKVKRFTTVGDLEADFKMAEELHNKGFQVTHVHVGEKNINTNRKFPVETTKSRFEKGTLEFLKTL